MQAGPTQSERFEVLLRPTLAGLQRFAVRLVRDPIGADDLLQQALVTGFTRFDQLEDERSFRVWINRILFRTHLNRKKRKTEQPVDPGILDNVVSLDAVRRPGPHEHYERAALADELAAALDSLPAEQRDAVWLVDGQGFRFGEAAEILEIPPGTAASRVARARLTLRGLLANVAQERGVIR